MASSSETQALLRITVKEEVTTQMAKARKEMQAFQKQTNDVQKAAKDMFRELAGPAAGFASAAGLVLLAKQSAAAADELNILHNRASVIFGADFPRMTQETERLGSQLRRSGSDLLGFSTNFTSLMSWVGIGKQTAEEMSIELTKLSVNLGNALGKSDIDGYDALQAAMRGNSRALGALNIVMNDATLAEYAHNQGIKQKVSDMNEAQQMALRYSFLMSKSAEINETAAKNTGSLSDSVQALQGDWQDLMETVGNTGGLELAIQGVNLLDDAVRKADQGIKALDASLQMQGAQGNARVLSAGWLTPKEFSDRYAGSYASPAGPSFPGSKDVKSIGSAADDSNRKVKDLINSLAGGGSGLGGTTKDEAKKAREAMEELGDSYDDAEKKIGEAIAEMETQHEEKMDSIKEEINSVQKALDELKKKYKETMDDLSSDEFESLSKQQEKVAKLTKEFESSSFFSQFTKEQAQQGVSMLQGYRQSNSLDEITKQEQHAFSWSDDTVKQLNTYMQLQKEQGALDKVLGGRSDRESLLAGASAASSKSDFEKEFEKFDKRRQQEREHYQESLREKEDELQKLQKKKELEQEVYMLQRQELQATTVALQFFHDDWTAKMASMQTVTATAVKQMKKDLEDLQNLMSSAQRLQQAKFNVGNGVDDRRASRAGGGTVSESMTWVGEYGPELVSLPYGSRVHTAAESRGMSGSGSITVNLGGVVIKNEADEDRLVQKVIREIQLSKLAA